MIKQAQILLLIILAGFVGQAKPTHASEVLIQNCRQGDTKDQPEGKQNSKIIKKLTVGVVLVVAAVAFYYAYAHNHEVHALDLMTDFPPINDRRGVDGLRYFVIQ